MAFIRQINCTKNVKNSFSLVPGDSQWQQVAAEGSHPGTKKSPCYTWVRTWVGMLSQGQVLGSTDQIRIFNII